jgi:hypothetical protein
MRFFIRVEKINRKPSKINFANADASIRNQSRPKPRNCITIDTCSMHENNLPIFLSIRLSINFS